MELSILIVDDEKHIRTGLAKYLKSLSYTVYESENGKHALDFLKSNSNKIDLVITDLKMPEMSGEEFLEKLGESLGDKIEVVVMTGHGTIENAVEMMKLGANDFLTKPINIDHLELILKRIEKSKALKVKYENLQKEIRRQKGFDNMLGTSVQIKKLLEVIENIAPSSASVLITGESGVGKEMVANEIHERSKRASKPLIKVHCASLNANLLESELFGHEKGSFTGASNRKIGRFELANGGTIFLDEIGEIDQTTQIKLLRVLQERVFERVGGQESIKVDVRILSATNKNLEEEIKNKTFREDLYYRLNVIKIEVPPLREHTEDLPILVNNFLSEFAKENDKKVKYVDPKAMDVILSYSFPGNVRELRNCIENAVIMCKGETLKVEDLPLKIRNSEEKKIIIPVGLSLKEAEKAIIKATLSFCNNNKSKAAELLQIERKTLYSKIEEL